MGVPVDAYLKAVAALVTALFAAVVLHGGPRRRPNRLLAAFLLLLAVNQGAEVLRSLSPERLLMWFRVATVAAALDPFVLWYFVVLRPEGGAPPARWKTGVLLAAAASFAALAPFLHPIEAYDARSGWTLLALTTFTALCYTLALRRVLGQGIEGEEGRSGRLLFMALCVAAVPVWPRLAGQLVILLGASSPLENPELRRLAANLVAIVLASGVLLRLGGRPARWGVAVGASLALVVWCVEAVEIILQPGPAPAALLRALGRGVTPVRWLAFSVLVSMALLRHHMLGMGLAARRRGARVVLGITFLLAAAALAGVVRAAFGLEPVPTAAPELVLFLAALVVSQGFRGIVDRAALRVYGVPLPGDVAESRETYRRAASEALLAGRSLASDAELARLRRDLGLDELTARALEADAEPLAWRPLAPGSVVAGRYRVERVLGSGGGGRAFLARDEVLLRDVALKEVRADHGLEAALREARMAGAVLHPNLVVVHDVLPRQGGAIIVNEHVPGGSLRDRLEPGAPLPPALGHAIVRDVLEGLAAVHARGIVHRDLKPSNVLLTPEGRAKVCDFGLARAQSSTTAQEAEGALGTPLYMAPEQRRGERVGPATDVYLVGRLAREILDAPSPSVEAVLRKALAEEPGERWADAGAMLAEWDVALMAGDTRGSTVPPG